MKKIKLFLITFAKGVTFLIALFFVAIVLLSVRIDKEKSVNPYCKNQYIEESFSFVDESIKKATYAYNCNTLYVQLELQDETTKEEVIAILTNIMFDLKKYDCFTHFEIIGKKLDKTIYATINLKAQTISFVG